jgi:hypothetical protein
MRRIRQGLHSVHEEVDSSERANGVGRDYSECANKWVGTVFRMRKESGNEYNRQIMKATLLPNSRKASKC